MDCREWDCPATKSALNRRISRTAQVSHFFDRLSLAREPDLDFGGRIGSDLAAEPGIASFGGLRKAFSSVGAFRFKLELSGC